MSLYIGAVFERAIHFEAVIVLRSEILDVPQYNTFAVGAALALELHRSHLTTTKTGADDISRPIESGALVHPEDPPPQFARYSDMAAGADYNLTQLTLSLHTGTHFDAPLHFGVGPPDGLL